MKLTGFSAAGFRNLEPLEFTPGAALTVICGRNGQGKTNLLEAIWLLTGGKSFRGARDAELVGRGKEFAVLEGDVDDEERPQHIQLTVGLPGSGRPGRTARVNGVDMGRAGAIAGTFTAVVFEPGHLSLVKSSPGGRRNFLDAALCQLYPGYLGLMRRYLRVVTQKNALLKAWNRTAGAGEMRQIFDEQLLTLGEEIGRRRQEYLTALSGPACRCYEEISGGSEALTLAYRPSTQPGESLAQALERLRAAELRAGCCLAGPHRDDFEVLLNGQPARVFGSQGQQRSVVLSLKLAEAEQARQVTGRHPVMLLDDVLSELDAGRQSYLLTRMEGKQTFVTACESAAFLRTDGVIYTMEAGRLSRA